MSWFKKKDKPFTVLPPEFEFEYKVGEPQKDYDVFEREFWKAEVHWTLKRNDEIVSEGDEIWSEHNFRIAVIRDFAFTKHQEYARAREGESIVHAQHAGGPWRVL